MAHKSTTTTTATATAAAAAAAAAATTGYLERLKPVLNWVNVCSPNMFGEQTFAQLKTGFGHFDEL